MLIEKVKKLISHIRKRRITQGKYLLVLMFISGISEMISLGAILPFLAVLTNPDLVYNNYFMQPIIKMLEFDNPTQLIFPIAILFCIVVIITTIVRVLMLYMTTRLSFVTGAELGVNIYNNTLQKSYTEFTKINSSEIINGITQKINVIINSVLIQILTLISSIILIIFILVTLMFVDWFISIITILVFSFIYYLTIKVTKKTLTRNSEIVAYKSTKVIQVLQEGLGGIRDVILGNMQSTYCDIFRQTDIPMRRAQAENQFISRSPKYLVEAIGMILMATIAYILLQGSRAELIVPILGVLALSAQKLLPLFQLCYSAISQIKGTEANLDDVLKLLEGSTNENKFKEIKNSIKFNKLIKLENIDYKYSVKEPWVVCGINLEIKKGSCIGIVGETGSGKSTLVDILMGLLKPSNGKLLVDNIEINEENIKDWMSMIAHVPQNIYLIDGSIAQNIAFGIGRDLVDMNKVRRVAKLAHISESIERWPKKYNTQIGENGVRLSGGQRQRVGIARALYQNKDILVLDEATSALDINTEKKIMNSIFELDDKVTVIIIAHRTDTLKSCSNIFTVENIKIRKNV